MQCTIKCLSTKSGKSVLLTIENSMYVFNLFEGFQRYCIETNISLKFITAVFIPDKKCIPPLCGLYLTLRDMNIKLLKIVCSVEIEILIKKAFTFCPPNNLKLIFIQDNYEDKFINVSDEYILQIKKFRGRFNVENVPPCVPKHFYKDLILGNEVIIEDKVYNSKNYLDPDIYIKKIFILINNKLEITDNSKIICFKRSDYNKYKSKNTWLISRPTSLDFISQYNLLAGLNNICKDYLLPFKPNKGYRIHRTYKIKNKGKWNLLSPFRYTNYLYTTDYFKYSKEIGGLSLIRGKRILIDSKFNNLPDSQVNGKNYALILGSGCAIPSKYRNVTSIFILINEIGILLDCGEDSINQLLRLKGGFKLIKSIECIFISHSHGDHSLGLVNFLYKTKKKIKLFAPLCIIDFVMSFNQNIEPFPTDISRQSNKLILKYNFEYKNEILEINFCQCLHNVDSCSISLKYKNIKISYSGDTRPSSLFAEMSSDSNLMIHESTFNDENIDKAIKTNHSTVGEACKIFNLSKSKVCLLTHFSQRYSKKFISNTLGIPCHDFYKYEIGKSIYNFSEINKYLENL